MSAHPRQVAVCTAVPEDDWGRVLHPGAAFNLVILVIELLSISLLLAASHAFHGWTTPVQLQGQKDSRTEPPKKRSAMRKGMVQQASAAPLLPHPRTLSTRCTVVHWQAPTQVIPVAPSELGMLTACLQRKLPQVPLREWLVSELELHQLISNT